MSFTSHTITIPQHSPFDKWHQCIHELSELELELYLLEDNKSTPEIKERRQCLSIKRVELQNRLLAVIAQGLNSLNEELREGIKELDKAIREIENTVKVLKAMNKVIGIIEDILQAVIPG